LHVIPDRPSTVVHGRSHGFWHTAGEESSFLNDRHEVSDSSPIVYDIQPIKSDQQHIDEPSNEPKAAQSRGTIFSRDDEEVSTNTKQADRLVTPEQKIGFTGPLWLKKKTFERLRSTRKVLVFLIWFVFATWIYYILLLFYIMMVGSNSSYYWGEMTLSERIDTLRFMTVSLIVAIIILIIIGGRLRGLSWKKAYDEDKARRKITIK